MPLGTLMTIGHSTLPIEVFLGALKENGCELLVDVRRYPGSSRHPQFGQARLFASLAAADIGGVWRESLGGRRKAVAGSINAGWRSQAFRGYADYMQTEEFTAEIDWLTAQMQQHSVAVMCAEALPWRCHRSLIADAVVARGFLVEDILVPSHRAGPVPAQRTSSRKPHALPAFARAEQGRIWYPGDGETEPRLFL